jgi:hypothetical protein
MARAFDYDGRVPVLDRFGGATGVVRIKADGAVKSLHQPVRGADPYRVAGDPKSQYPSCSDSTPGRVDFLYNPI